MLYAVILAGGSGTRLWPESRAARPKQFLKIGGDRTLLQAVVDRLGHLVPPDRVLIATRRDLASAVQEQLSHLPREAILAEPCPRNTAPCIGLAALRLLRDDPKATMAVLPADQVIWPHDTFQNALRVATTLLDEDPHRLVTFGIRPRYPATGFGYIERGEPLEGPSSSARLGALPAFRVAKFHEKPPLELAEQYCRAGRFYWNSGMFVWRARTILDALARHRPAVYVHLERIAAAVDSPQFPEVLQHEFDAMESISIDYAVMERAEHVVVVEAPFEWDDVGSWRALERLNTPDAHGNVINATWPLLLDTRGSIVRVAEPDHAVVLVGVEDLIVVVTPDATLVANKHHEESIRQVADELRKRGWTEYL